MKKTKKIMCVLPKYSYGDIDRGISPEYNAIYKSIKKNFYKVYYFDTLALQNLNKTNSDLFNKVKKIKPDIIFFAISSYEINIETLVKIKKNFKCFMINWSSDDEWRFYQHSKLLSPYFDCMITTSKKAKKHYDEAKKFSILSHWGCPDEWIGIPLIAKKCRYDVTFVGKSYFDRKSIIEYLISQNIKVTCFGYGWGTRILKDNEISKIFRNSKISLNFSTTRGSDKSLKARVFEVTGAGGFLMTEHSDNLENFFNRKQISIFKTKEELSKKIKKILSNNKLRDEMVSISSKVSKYYSYSNIIKKIFNEIEKKKSKRKNNLEIIDFKKLSSLELNILKTYKMMTITMLNLFFDKKKSLRISRRLLFELEWRVRREKTYTSAGWCFNLFNII